MASSIIPVASLSGQVTGGSGTAVSFSGGIGYCLINCPQSGDAVQRAMSDEALNLTLQVQETATSVGPSSLVGKLGFGDWVANGHLMAGRSIPRFDRTVVGVEGDCALAQIIGVSMNLRIPDWVPTLHGGMTYSLNDRVPAGYVGLSANMMAFFDSSF